MEDNQIPFKNAVVFIDGDYIYHLTKKLKLKIDFAVFYKLLNQMFKNSTIYYYSSINPESKHYQSYQSFLNVLSNLGYSIKVFELRKVNKTEIYKSNIDVNLSLDALSVSDSCEKIVLISGDSDFVPVVKQIKAKGKKVIVIGSNPTVSLHLKKEADAFYDLKKILVNKDNAENIQRAKFNKTSNFFLDLFIDTKKEDRIRKEIRRTLDELFKMIKDKKTETELHKFIRENNLIPSPFIKHEFSVLSQNREDFLIENEFGEFEIWELKSPSVRLFDVDKVLLKRPERYDKLKALSKTSNFVSAIEQLSIYKKEFIDHNQQHPQDHQDLREHIYNAKLVLVIGSDEELEKVNKEIYIEKLNLERYMLNNLNIITWEMFFKKIKSYYIFLDN